MTGGAGSAGRVFGAGKELLGMFLKGRLEGRLLANCKGFVTNPERQRHIDGVEDEPDTSGYHSDELLNVLYPSANGKCPSVR